MTDTRPGEISRIARDETEFRVTTLTSLARMEEWMKGHDRRDDERFQRQDEKLDSLEDRIGTVSSSVTTTESQKAQIKGAWRMAAYLVSGLIVGGGFVLALLTYLHEVSK